MLTDTARIAIEDHRLSCQRLSKTARGREQLEIAADAYYAAHCDYMSRDDTSNAEEALAMYFIAYDAAQNY